MYSRFEHDQQAAADVERPEKTVGNPAVVGKWVGSRDAGEHKVAYNGKGNEQDEPDVYAPPYPVQLRFLMVGEGKSCHGVEHTAQPQKYGAHQKCSGGLLLVPSDAAEEKAKHIHCRCDDGKDYRGTHMEGVLFGGLDPPKQVIRGDIK